MSNEVISKANEIAKKNAIEYDADTYYYGRECECQCFNSAIDMAAWKDEQVKELIHKASLAYMQDLGEQLGHIQLKAAKAMKNCKDDDMLKQIEEITLATTRANSFMLTLEEYLLKELNNQVSK